MGGQASGQAGGQAVGRSVRAGRRAHRQPCVCQDNVLTMYLFLDFFLSRIS
jgi:hypothetical protein